MNESFSRDALLHITDIHFWEVVLNPLRLLNKRLLGNINVWWRRRHELHTERAEAFAEALVETSVRTLFASGDFTSTATEWEFQHAAAFLRKLAERGLRILVVPGNHDVYTFEAQRNRRLERYLGDFLPAEGYPCRFELPGGTPVILAPTVCTHLVSSRGRITDTEIQAVKQLIAETPPGPVIVGGHYPVLHRTPAFASGPLRRLRNAAALRRIFGSSGRRILYISGHVHHFSYVQDSRYENVQHLMTSALFLQRRNRGPAGSFAEIQVRSEGFDVYRHEYDARWRRTRETASQEME